MRIPQHRSQPRSVTTRHLILLMQVLKILHVTEVKLIEVIPFTHHRNDLMQEFENPHSRIKS